MSISIMTRVWGSPAIDTQSDLCILLALADWANDDGECWPSLEQLAKKSRMHRATVHRRLAAMRGHWVEWQENNGGRSQRNRYTIMTEHLTTPLPDDPKPSHDATVSEDPKPSHSETVSEVETVAPRDIKPSHHATGNKPSIKPPVLNNKPPAAVHAEDARAYVHEAAAGAAAGGLHDLSFLTDRDSIHAPGIREALRQFPSPMPDMLVQKYWRRRSFVDFHSLAKLANEHGWARFVAAVVISINASDNPGLPLLGGILRRFNTPARVAGTNAPAPQVLSVFDDEEFNQLLRS
jgi:hypothetical protein